MGSEMKVTIHMECEECKEEHHDIVMVPINEVGDKKLVSFGYQVEHDHVNTAEQEPLSVA